MTTPRNFFRLRTAHQTQSDDLFLALFSSRVVDLLDGDYVWDRLVRLESAPGGGKSSLLRLFRPGSLSRVFRSRNNPDGKGLADQLKALGAMDDSGPRLLGVYVDCNQDYSQIAEQDLDDNEKLTWFLTLLDARVTLITLRVICQLADLQFPDEIDRITFDRRTDTMVTDTLEDTVEGRELYDRARDMEAMVASAVNRLGRTPRLDLSPKIRLDLPALLSSHTTKVNGASVYDRALLMFDDAHSLEPQQLEALETELRRHDLSVSRWIAMRLTALTPQQVMSEPTRSGREVVTIRLDDSTRRGFGRWLSEVADRRAVRAEPSVQSFQSLLANDLDSDMEFEPAVIARESEETTALELVHRNPELFEEWVAETKRAASSSSPVEAAGLWALLQILAERRLHRRQAEFDFASLPRTDLAAAPADATEAAKLFVARRHKLPYYYGVRKVAQLGSSNVEQFLAVSADLFDAIVNAGLLSRSGYRQLSARQQDKIIRASSRAYLANIRREVPYGGDVLNLISAVGALAGTETYRPTAPYAPGITGFALSMADRASLLDGSSSDQSPGAARLLRTLHAAIAHNVLNPRLDQKVKGGDWMVLYLNRLLCPAFNLPLGYGGFREQSLDEVEYWVAEGIPQAQKRFEFN